jgi:hypothetical protein
MTVREAGRIENTAVLLASCRAMPDVEVYVSARALRPAFARKGPRPFRDFPGSSGPFGAVRLSLWAHLQSADG